MNFNWIFVNPFHATGSSGSIYAIKDPYSLSDLTLGNLPRQEERTALRQFTAEGQRHGLRMKMDLVINHTAQDAAGSMTAAIGRKAMGVDVAPNGSARSRMASFSVVMMTPAPARAAAAHISSTSAIVNQW